MVFHGCMGTQIPDPGGTHPVPGYAKTPDRGGIGFPTKTLGNDRLDERSGVDMEKDMTLAATYSSNGLPRKYHRRVGLNFRVRKGNGCFPDAMTTRVMSLIENRMNMQMPAPSKLYEPITSPTY